MLRVAAAVNRRATSAGARVGADSSNSAAAPATWGDAIEVRYVIAKGYYLYRDKLKLQSPDGTAVVGALVLPAGEEKDDEEFGRVFIYRNELRVPVPVRSLLSLPFSKIC